MGKLWIFGDSNSALYSDPTMVTQHWIKPYVEFLGHTPKHFSELLAEKLELELVNLGMGGSDNYTIFETLYNNIHKMDKESDVIFVGLTDHTRFRIAQEKLGNEYFRSVTVGGNNDDLNVSQEAINEILVNRMSNLFVREFEIKVNIFKQLLTGYKIYFWCLFDGLRESKGIINTMKLGYLYKKGNISPINLETDGKINDGHIGEKGNALLAELFHIFMNEKRIAYVKDIYNETRVIKFL